MKDNVVSYDNIYTTEERKKLIAEMLKTHRQLNKYTQKEVAEHIGVNAETYATYERGRNEPSAEMLVRLSYLYNVPVDFLIQRDNLYKDENSTLKAVNEFQNAIDEMRGKILSGDPQTRDILKQFTNSLNNMVDIIKDVELKNNNGEQ